MRVHPTYDPGERLWWADDACACTLADLQLLLPDTVIEGYYPGGYVGEPWGSGSGLAAPRVVGRAGPDLKLRQFHAVRAQARAAPAPAQRSDRLVTVLVPKPKKTTAPAPLPNSKPVIRRDDVLELWAAGRPDSEIATMLGTTVKYVANLVASARARGDSRAVRRSQTGPHRRVPGFWTDARRDQLVAMAARGLSAGQIAAHLGTSRNAVLGLAWREAIKLWGSLGTSTSRGQRPMDQSAVGAAP